MSPQLLIATTPMLQGFLSLLHTSRVLSASAKRSKDFSSKSMTTNTAKDNFSDSTGVLPIWRDNKEYFRQKTWLQNSLGPWNIDPMMLSKLLTGTTTMGTIMTRVNSPCHNLKGTSIPKHPITRHIYTRSIKSNSKICINNTNICRISNMEAP